MNQQTVIALCHELAEEAGAIEKYTQDIDAISATDPEAAATFEDIRLDELEHVQKIALQLTSVLSAPPEGAEAEKNEPPATSAGGDEK